MSTRHEKLGVKQTIRYEWMQKATNLMLSGLDARTIREELHQFLSDRKGNGSEEVRSENTRTFVVNNLMNIWVSPEPDLIPFRDASLAVLREGQSSALAVHWGMISAAYPFWLQVASQVGRLLALQDQITRPQIFARVKEQYGDREVIARNSRYIVRSFVAWGVLTNTNNKGCYEIADLANIFDTNVAALLLESILLATLEAKGSLHSLLSHPACFPFRMPALTGNLVMQCNTRVEVARHGLNEELLQLA